MTAFSAEEVVDAFRAEGIELVESPPMATPPWLEGRTLPRTFAWLSEHGCVDVWLGTGEPGEGFYSRDLGTGKLDEPLVKENALVFLGDSGSAVISQVKAALARLGSR
jgi:hypothetical protein